MATIEDRWWSTSRDAEGSTQKVKTARHGTGKRWLVRYRDPDGTSRKCSFARKADADAKKSTVEADILRGAYLDPQGGKVTFGAYVEQWLATRSSDPLTQENIEGRLRRYVQPHALYRMPLRAIRPSTVQAWLKSLEPTIAPATIRVVFSHVSAAMNAAVEDDLIGKNPCRASSVRPPKLPDRQVVPWSREWVAGMRAELPDRYGVLVTLGAGLGLRQGEMFGLAVEDVDWLRGWVTVRRQVKLVRSRQVFAPPKGGRSRTIPLPATVREDLAAYLTRWPARTVTLPWSDPDAAQRDTAELLVTSRKSNALNRNDINQNTWKPALARVGVEDDRSNGMHALRHYFASVLLEGGASIKAVSEYLGHHSASFTLQTYTHLMPSSEEQARVAVDAALGSLPCAPCVPHEA